MRNKGGRRSSSGFAINFVQIFTAAGQTLSQKRQEEFQLGCNSVWHYQSPITNWLGGVKFFCIYVRQQHWHLFACKLFSISLHASIIAHDAISMGSKSCTLSSFKQTSLTVSSMITWFFISSCISEYKLNNSPMSVVYDFQNTTDTYSAELWVKKPNFQNLGGRLKKWCR